MDKFAVFLLLLAIFHLSSAIATGKPKCKTNEEYQECGSACPITCENKNDPPQFCTKQCVSGCFCRSGFIRDTETGLCVKENECTFEKLCPLANETYSKCGANGCQNTCEQPKLSTYCRGTCVPGCVCREGYIKNSLNICIPREECECLEPHEIWTDCENNSCQRDCRTFGMNLACKPICTPGCICERGYLRNSQGVCVAPLDCDGKLCPEPNTVFTDCDPCDNTCEILAANATCNFLVCNIGCTCAAGFYKNSRHECVLPEDCDVCGENEMFSVCDDHPCRDTCSAPDFSQRCRYIPGCYPGCICKNGYLKDGSRKCVPREQCVKKCSDPNAEYLKCKRCVGSCDDKNPICDKSCNPPGCYCKPGYIKKSKTDPTCIKETQCLPKCKDPNAEYLTCKRCVGSCDNRKPICDKSCNPPGCYCKMGYIKKSKSNPTCIKESQCPIVKPPTTSKTEGCGF